MLRHVRTVLATLRISPILDSEVSTLWGREIKVSRYSHFRTAVLVD